MCVRHPEVHSANPKEESGHLRHLKTEKNGLTNYRYYQDTSNKCKVKTNKPFQ